MCYYIKTLYFNDPLFNETDATYIIHLENNGRYKNIEKELKKYHPTNIVHILFNKGYKKCEKLGINTPPIDLIDAYTYVMNHATRYKTILILEDDFIFNTNIKQHANNIDTFVKSHTHFLYRIGCLPAVQIPYNINNYLGICVGAHSIFYSKSMRDKLLSDIKNTQIDDWDVHLCFNTISYIYYSPLCYQLLPAACNQKHWGIHNTIMFFLSKILVVFLQLLNLDTQPEPGYSILYVLSKIWILIMVLIIT